MPRSRDQIVASLEKTYREAFSRADETGDEERMHRLDFDFRRDQLFMEAVLDVRDLLANLPASEPETKKEPSVLEKVENIRRLTRGPFRL